MFTRKVFRRFILYRVKAGDGFQSFFQTDRPSIVQQTLFDLVVYHLPCTSEIPRSQPSLDSMIHVVYGSKVIESDAQQHDMLCNPTRYSCSKQELACLQAWMSWSSKQKQFGIALEWTQVWSKIGYWDLVDFGNDLLPICALTRS